MQNTLLYPNYWLAAKFKLTYLIRYIHQIVTRGCNSQLSLIGTCLHVLRIVVCIHLSIFTNQLLRILRPQNLTLLRCQLAQLISLHAFLHWQIAVTIISNEHFCSSQITSKYCYGISLNAIQWNSTDQNTKSLKYERNSMLSQTTFELL